MDFELLQQSFEQKYTTRYNSTEYDGYHIKWAFENFTKLISKTTFQASITINLDFQLNQNLIHELDQKIDSLRKFFQTVNESIIKYLNEIDDFNFQMKIYDDFLANFYKGFKDYVNDGLIPWIYANVMHNFVTQGGLLYEPNPYLDYIFSKFEFKLMQKMRLYLKGISAKNPTDHVFRILVDTYTNQLVDKQKAVQQLKQKSLI